MLHFVSQKMSSTQTPLMGGEGPDLANSDFGGITPRNAVPVTPHALTGDHHQRATMTINISKACDPAALQPWAAADALDSLTWWQKVGGSNTSCHCVQVQLPEQARRLQLAAPSQALQRRRGGPLPAPRCARQVLCVDLSDLFVVGRFATKA